MRILCRRYRLNFIVMLPQLSFSFPFTETTVQNAGEDVMILNFYLSRLNSVYAASYVHREQNRPRLPILNMLSVGWQTLNINGSTWRIWNNIYSAISRKYDSFETETRIKRNVIIDNKLALLFLFAISSVTCYSQNVTYANRYKKHEYCYKDGASRYSYVFYNAITLRVARFWEKHV